jgi:hypothetical protein
METLVGFAVGFLVGTKEGKEGLAKILESWTAIKDSGQVRKVVGMAFEVGVPILRDLVRSV